MSKTTDTTPAQIPVLASVLPDGNGGFIVKPQKPAAEITTEQARKILGVCRAQMWYLRNQPMGQKILKWRFTSEKRGKILWDAASVLAYKEATKGIED